MGGRVLNPKLTTRQLAALLDGLATATSAGIPVQRAVRLVAEGGAGLRVRRLARRVHAAIERGATFAQAIQWERTLFPPHLVQLVDVGERSGRLEPMIALLAQRYQDRVETYRRVWQQVSYPLFVIIAILVFIPMIVTWFGGIAEGKAWNDGITDVLLVGFHRAWPIAAVAAVVCVLWRWLPCGTWASWIPAVRRRGIRYRFALSRFSGTMATLLEAGITARDAIPMAAAAASPYFTLALKDAPDAIARGASFTEALRASNLFTTDTIETVAIGETAGKLAETFARLDRDTYNAALYAVRNIIVTLEAALILLIGFYIVAGRVL